MGSAAGGEVGDTAPGSVVADPHAATAIKPMEIKPNARNLSCRIFIACNLRKPDLATLIVRVSQMALVVFVKSFAALPAKVARVHHLPQKARRPVLVVAEVSMQHLDDKEHHIQPDEIRQR